MSEKQVTLVRIYTLEGRDELNRILNILRDELDIHGVTVLRAIEGFGRDMEIHSSSLLSLSLELPLIIEFYEEVEKANTAIAVLKSRLDLKHIISWQATAH